MEHDDRDDDEGLNACIVPFSLYRRETSITTYEVALHKEIYQTHAYAELFAAIRELPNSCAKVVLLLKANGGGFLDAEIALYNAFRSLTVPVDVICEGACESGGGMLALCGTSLTLQPGAMLMFHNFSTAHEGKAKEVADACASDIKVWKRILIYQCTPFLTDDEIQSIIHDNDVRVYWHQKDLKLRLKRHFSER